MKKILIAIAAIFSTTMISAQGEVDAIRLGATDLNGTARYMSMGGAFGALGGDVSVLQGNPAGIGVYHSSEIVTSISLNSPKITTNFNNKSLAETRTRFQFDNLAYVGYFPTGADEGILSWNVGFSYNRLKNFNRDYSLSGVQDYSLTDYIAERSFGTPKNNIEINTNNKNDIYYNSGHDWLSILGYDAGLIDAYSNGNEYYSPFGEKTGNDWRTYKIQQQSLQVHEEGYIDQYNITAGTNINDILMLGATIAVTDLRYDLRSNYNENFEQNSSMYLDNWLTTKGSGYQVILGAIVCPTSFLRLGVAYQSPTWYKLTDYFFANAGSDLYFQDNGDLKQRKITAETVRDSYFDYQYHTPDKWIFSAAGIIGTTALVSVDYEIKNYKNTKLYSADGVSNTTTNEYIQNDFGVQQTLKVGTEVRFTPQFAVRLGGMYSKSPATKTIQDGNIEVLTVGTLPHYTIDKNSTAFSVGLGYRFTPQFYGDIACVLSTHKENAYLFSNKFDDNGDSLIKSDAIEMKTENTKVAITFGYKF